MNLQENIQRIHEMMGLKEQSQPKILSKNTKEKRLPINPYAKVDTATQLKKEIEENFVELKKEYKEYLDDSKKVIDPYKIIDKFKEYLISKIPEIIPQLKTGKGGAKFAYDCFIFVKNLVQEEIKSMGFIKRNTVKLLAGGKESLRKQMNEKDIREYISLFMSLVDFYSMIRYVGEMQTYAVEMYNWGKDNINWVRKNQSTIKTDIVNTIVNNLYS